MTFALTYEDRMALLDRARDDVGNKGLYDYYGKLIELVLMDFDRKDEIIAERHKDFEPQTDVETKEAKHEVKTVTHLRIVK